LLKEKFLRIYSSSNNKIDLLIDLSKIAIILIAAIYLFGNFTPFYEAKDAYLYGIEAINLSEGVYSISNELLTETARPEFVGENWRKTIHNDAVPAPGIGTPLLGALFYIFGGYYGLFYLGPILGILLLITFERISTKLFGKYVGFLSLLFLATCHILFRSAVLPNTDAILTLFFIPGIYYLIKFLKNKDGKTIFLASSFFAIAALIKIPGIIYFPIELFLIFGYFILQKINNKKIEKRNIRNNFKTNFNLISKKKIIKISILLFIPWIIFFGFWFSHNDFYYGAPTTTYLSIKPGVEISSSSHIGTLLTLEQRDYDQFKDYSKYLLPYQIPAIYNKVSENLDDIFSKNWPGLISPFIIILALIISFREKQKRTEIIVMSFFIAGIIWFYSGQSSVERASFGLPSRFMLPALSLSFILLSYLIVKLLKSNIFENIPRSKNHTKIFKKIFIVGLGIFFIGAFYFTPPIQIFVNEDISFKNPQIYAERYPLDLEGITENDVIVSIHNDWAIEYDAIPFVITYQREINPESATLLKKIILDGYDVYVFKEVPWDKNEKVIWFYLIENYQIVFKDHSTTFCKMFIVETEHEKSDDICISIKEP
jgi:hypothetical protein